MDDDFPSHLTVTFFNRHLSMTDARQFRTSLERHMKNRLPEEMIHIILPKFMAWYQSNTSINQHIVSTEVKNARRAASRTQPPQTPPAPFSQLQRAQLQHQSLATPAPATQTPTSSQLGQDSLTDRCRQMVASEHTINMSALDIYDSYNRLVLERARAGRLQDVGNLIRMLYEPSQYGVISMAVASIQRRARLDVDCGYGELQAQLAFLQVVNCYPAPDKLRPLTRSSPPLPSDRLLTVTSTLPQPKQIDMWPTGFYGEPFVNIFLSMIQEPYYVTEKLKDDLFDNLHPTSTRGLYLCYHVNKVVERAMANHLAPPPPGVVPPISLLQGDHDSCTTVAVLNFLVNQPNPETLARRLRETVQATLPYTVDARECAMRDNEVYSLHCLVSASATTAEYSKYQHASDTTVGDIVDSDDDDAINHSIIIIPFGAGVWELDSYEQNSPCYLGHRGPNWMDVALDRVRSWQDRDRAARQQLTSEKEMAVHAFIALE